MQTRLPKTKCVWPMKINVICTVDAINGCPVIQDSQCWNIGLNRPEIANIILEMDSYMVTIKLVRKEGPVTLKSSFSNIADGGHYENYSEIVPSRF